MDPTLRMADYPQVPVDEAHMPKAVRQPRHTALPDAEMRQLAEYPIDSAIRKAIVEDNQVKPDYARIGVPVLAIYGVKTVDQILKEFEPRTAEERSALFQRYVAARAMLERWEGDLRAGVPGARIVELPGAELYMFLSNEADIIREVRAFGLTLKR